MFAHNGHDLITASESEGNAFVWRSSPDFSTIKKVFTLHSDISKYHSINYHVDFSKCRSKVKLSNCIWSYDDSCILTSSWLKRFENKKAIFEVDIKCWNADTGKIEYTLNHDENPVIVGPVFYYLIYVLYIDFKYDSSS